MARNVSALAASIKAAFEAAYTEKDPVNRDAALTAISTDIATAIDNYIAAIVTSVDSETLV